MYRWDLIIACCWLARPYRTTCWNSTLYWVLLHRTYSDTNMSTILSAVTVMSPRHPSLTVCWTGVYYQQFVCLFSRCHTIRRPFVNHGALWLSVFYEPQKYFYLLSGLRKHIKLCNCIDMQFSNNASKQADRCYQAQRWKCKTSTIMQ